ncbi:MAG TPA: TetR/AcrR family transcriptional regulator [Sphingobium sp.]|uniref:TetR/AcrR family transcriptional regulator n=1 Tax=Sphingobium sp. TaxID=1912891 RepID=UPI002ED42BFD
MSIKPVGTPPTPSLRQARQIFARNHICEAARDLFFVQGYAATTFDQIARAAGTRRTTLYSHFADKAEILSAIGEAYYEGLCRIVEELPGPTPSRAEIDAWIDTLVRFVERERTPASLMIGLGVGKDTPPAVERLSQRFRDALSARLPAFAHADRPGPDFPLRQAWKRVVLRELSFGCLEAAHLPEEGQPMLTVAADLFERFIRENG